MKKILVSLIALFTVMACTIPGKADTIKGSKNYVTKEAHIGPIKHITLNGSMDLLFSQSEQQHIEVYAPDNLIDLIELKYENGHLTAGFKKNTSISHSGRIEIRVSGSAPQSINVSGSGDIELMTPIHTDQIAFSAHGSGDIKGSAVKATEVSVELRGSGDIDLRQIDTETLNINLYGSGDIKGGSITATRANLIVRGSGDTEFRQIKTDVLNAQVYGSGDIDLKGGTAQEAGYSVSGSGDIDAQHLVVEQVTAKVNGSGGIKCHATQTLSGTINGSGSIGYKGNPEISFNHKKKGLHKL